MDPVWEAVSRLERQGIRVLALTCDGASPNRRFWKLQGKGKEMIFKIDNLHAPEGVRSLFFVSDPPHLLKTIRNCFYSEKRNLCVSTCICNSNFTIIAVYCCSSMANTFRGAILRSYTKEILRPQEGFVYYQN